VLRAHSFDEAWRSIDRADEALRNGYHVAGFFSYEFGAACTRLAQRASEIPLLSLGIFESPQTVRLDDPRDAFALGPLRPRIGFDEYASTIEAIRRAIRDGEVYQVNYTLPFDARFSGDAAAAYAFLARRARAPYCALLEDGDYAAISLSPELFLRFDGERIETKPMKGTATHERIAELVNAKNRAEHVMIVDLLRNDLHKVCDDVTVERLFSEERYPTFATMTSTIAGTVRDGTSLREILHATFPCGSVTGAPKRAAMQHIATFEQHARDVYTGSIGYLSPQRRGWWNVAIRTLQVDTQSGAARIDAGGGIVSDSSAAGEWTEVAVKLRFVRDAIEPFAFWETFASHTDVEPHLQRMARAAIDFGVPFDMATAHERIAPFLPTAGLLVRLRLHLDGRIEAFADALVTPEEPVKVCIAAARVRSDDFMLAYKSSWRPAHEAAADEARRAGCFDALLVNERGELTEGTRTNVFVELEAQLFTPPLTSGVLPGILRARLLSERVVTERIVTTDDLRAADAVYIGNDARGLLRAALAGEPLRV